MARIKVRKGLSSGSASIARRRSSASRSIPAKAVCRRRYRSATGRAPTLRRSLSDWLADMGLLSAGHKATIDRYVGYYEPYAESHQALDADRAFQEETRNAARALVKAVKLLRKDDFPQPVAGLSDPRPK
jgi:hypothetical protein